MYKLHARAVSNAVEVELNETMDLTDLSIEFLVYNYLEQVT